MLNRSIHPPDGSFFLFGARGTGKSTWARATFPGKPYFDLLDQELFVSLQRDPGRFGRQLAAISSGETIVVDEIQRIPGLLNEVHRAIEARRQRFVLLGSSSRKLRRAGVNLLGGRASTRSLFPLLPSELDDRFDIEEALRFGTLPIVWASSNREETLAAYTNAYVSEEIRAEALVRNLGGFVRFLPVAALFHSQTINISELGRDAGVPRTTVEGYITVLEDTLLSWRLPAFEHRPRVRERAHPKLYWIDSGIVRSLKGNVGPTAQEERGVLLEGWVANVLRAEIDYHNAPIELSYLPRHGSYEEVDFLLRRGDEIVAIEVKSAPRVDSRSLKSLRTIAQMTGIARRILVCGVDRPEKTQDGIDVLPFQAFTRMSLPEGLFTESDIGEPRKA